MASDRITLDQAPSVPSKPCHCRQGSPTIDGNHPTADRSERRCRKQLGESMPDDRERREWVTRVLDFVFPTSTPRNSGASMTGDVWQAAADAVAGQLDALAAALRETAIPQLSDLSRDVEGLLREIGPTVAGALQAFDRNPADAQAREAALAAIAAARTWVGSDPRVPAVDGNLFGVMVTAGVTLDAALRELQDALSSGVEVTA